MNAEKNTDMGKTRSKDRKENCRDFNNVEIGKIVMKRWNKKE